MKLKNWKIEYDIPEVPQSLVDAGFSPLLAYVLFSRGANNPDEAQKMISVSPEVIGDPLEIKDMHKAVDRLNLAINNNEKIAVYGDYDVDGITSTCLVTDYLRSRGLDVTPYIPDRNEEGYGLNKSAIETFAQNNISLIITVDCGITALDESKHAASLGIDMIITDHHECKENEIPIACAVIDCKQPDDSYTFKHLAGVGTAFKLICALDGHTDKMLEKYCDLVAIGTVADVMPLCGENRYFVYRGLESLKANPRPGISAMLEKAGVEPETLTASSISFTLAPRINAAGRLNQAIIAFNLIMSSTEEEASQYADTLCSLNRERQFIENEIWKDASLRLRDYDTQKPIVLSSSSWHQGVIGIAASRIAEQYNIPTIMIYINGDIGKGSCRSYGGFNLFDALNACSDSLISFGGHALAAGLNIRSDMIEKFRKDLEDYYNKNKPVVVPDIQCDILICDPTLLTLENVKSLDLLEPCGNCNSRPLMCISGAKVESFISVGGGKHLKLTISYKGSLFGCIFFSHTPEEYDLHIGDYVDIAFHPQVNEFRGVQNVQLNLVDIRKHNSVEICENILSDDFTYYDVASAFCPSRPDFVRIWKEIEKHEIFGSTLNELLEFMPQKMMPEVYCICMKVFEELGLISSVFGGHTLKLAKKAELDSAEIMKLLKDKL